MRYIFCCLIDLFLRFIFHRKKHDFARNPNPNSRKLCSFARSTDWSPSHSTIDVPIARGVAEIPKINNLASLDKTAAVGVRLEGSKVGKKSAVFLKVHHVFLFCHAKVGKGGCYFFCKTWNTHMIPLHRSWTRCSIFIVHRIAYTYISNTVSILPKFETVKYCRSKLLVNLPHS